ncbi:hypothetical protein Tco_0438968 [Tanacetum coccineum]
MNVEECIFRNGKIRIGSLRLSNLHGLDDQSSHDIVIVFKELDRQIGKGCPMLLAFEENKDSFGNIHRTKSMSTLNESFPQGTGSASDEELEELMKDQPLSVDASPTTLSPGYIADFNPEEDKEDPEEDPADHPADG